MNNFPDNNSHIMHATVHNQFNASIMLIVSADQFFEQNGTDSVYFISSLNQSMRLVLGTGLMRILLDVHPWINCGAEPMVVLPVLKIRDWVTGTKRDVAIKANLYPGAIDRAVTEFIRQLAINMVSPAKMVCQKQPLIFQYLDYLGTQFAEAKFVHMLRDGRAATMSTIK